MKEIRIPEKLELVGKKVIIKTIEPSDYSALRDILSDTKTMEHLKYLSHAPNGWTVEEIKKRYDNFQQKQKDQKGLNFSIFDHIPFRHTQ